MESAFLAALHAAPSDEVTWLAMADWLEENGQNERAELVRLVRQLRKLPVMKRTVERARREARLAALLEAGVRPVVPEVVNSIGMRLALIPPGRFRMGSPRSEADRQPDEGPLHEVEITRPFYLGVFAVTQGQWQAIMGSNPSCFSSKGSLAWMVEGLDTSDFPVAEVSWEDAQAFLQRLSEKSAGRLYRLPSEAEWEYACRGGASSTTPFYLGSTLSSTQANFDGRHPYRAEKGPRLGRTCAVGSYRPNAFGLFDMHGNVTEWCEDRYGEDYYGNSPSKDPPGPAAGDLRVYRGGGFPNYGLNCRAAYRGKVRPSYRYWSLGFRVAAARQG